MCINRQIINYFDTGSISNSGEFRVVKKYASVADSNAQATSDSLIAGAMCTALCCIL